MNHRERVLAVFEGKYIDRPPMWYGAHPETTANVARMLGVSVNEKEVFLERPEERLMSSSLPRHQQHQSATVSSEESEEKVLEALGIDFRTVRPEYIGEPFETFADGTYMTEWGIRRGGLYWGQALSHPLAEANSLKDLENYDWPDPALWRVDQVPELARRYSNYCIIGGAWSPFFHDVIELFGMEKACFLMFDQPDLIEAVVDRCSEFYLDQTRRMFSKYSKHIDMFFFGNDFGSQQGLMISPKMWRRFFREPIRRMIDLAHRYGIRTALHSCGSIWEIIPDLIEMGVDALNPIQPTANGMDPERLCREFGKDLVFFGGIDVTHILRECTPEQVRLEVRRVINIMSYAKGFILAPSHDFLLPEVPAENIIALYQEGSCTI
ncbi:MAG: hypothetical protein M1371_12060 [Actinobacteria bacterium]|nr:hypothetical protein [Actinomycetota bacterium]